MDKKELQKKFEELELEEAYQNRLSNLNRSRSVTVGTSFGGTTEISMRGEGEKFLYCIMQPVEVIELIHQLAANVGCHLMLKPRDDFSSWREWRIPEAEKQHLGGFPPFVNDMAPFNQLGASGYNQEETETLLKKFLELKEYSALDENFSPGGRGGEGNTLISDATPGESPQETKEFLNKKIKRQRLEEKFNEKAVAAKKPSNKRTTKRSSTTS